MRHSLNGVRRLALLAALWILGAGGAAAQAATGAVTGVVRGDGAPLPLALVHLQSTDSAAAAARPVLTDDAGRYRFDNVQPGVYRLRVVRVGYAPGVSAPLAVRSGETLQHDMRSSTVAIRLAALTVGPSRCLQAGQLEQVPAVATLWNEARKGREVRDVFLQQYSFVTVQNYVTHHRTFGGGKRTTTRSDTTVFVPDSALVWEARRRASHAGGYGTRRGEVLHRVAEVDILNDEFLKTHCVEGAVEEGDGMLGLRFRPIQNRRGFIDIGGVVWVDADDFLMRRLDFEYLDGGRPLAVTSYTYGDVAVGEGVFRLIKRVEQSGRGRQDWRLDVTNTQERIRRVR